VGQMPPEESAAAAEGAVMSWGRKWGKGRGWVGKAGLEIKR
jgi:hypothetical protein